MMDLKLRKLEDIWTNDGRLVGQAHSLYHRLGDVDPELKLYATYLLVISFEIGEDYYIPTDFIEGRDPETGRVMLSVDMLRILEETWERMPDFVARGEAKVEALSKE